MEQTKPAVESAWTALLLSHFAPLYISHCAEIAEYTAQCQQRYGGNCDLDVDECQSSPCAHDNQCVDSHNDPSVPKHAYRCICSQGWANGDVSTIC